MLQQLRDLVTFADEVWFLAEVLHEHDDLTAVASVNHSGVAHQALPRQTRARLHDAARGRHELDGDAGANSCGPARRNRQVFAGVEIVADVFSGMSHSWQNCVRREPLHFQHGYITGGTVIPITPSTVISSRRTTATVASRNFFRPSSASVRMW